MESITILPDGNTVEPGGSGCRFCSMCYVAVGSVVWCGISAVPSSTEGKSLVIPFQILVVKVTLMDFSKSTAVIQELAVLVFKEPVTETHCKQTKNRCCFAYWLPCICWLCSELPFA